GNSSRGGTARTVPESTGHCDPEPAQRVALAGPAVSGGVRVAAAPPDVKTGPLAVRTPAPAPRHDSAMPATGSCRHDDRHDRRSRGRIGGMVREGDGEGDRAVNGEWWIGTSGWAERGAKSVRAMMRQRAKRGGRVPSRPLGPAGHLPRLG